MKHTATQIAIAILSMLALGACGSGGDEERSAEVIGQETSTVAEAALPTPTLTAVPEPTPTERATSTPIGSITPPPDATVAMIGEFESVEGWRYRLDLVEVSVDPSGGDLGIDPAPPTSTNVRATIRETNLLSDREAPWPELVFGTNIREDGGAEAVTSLLDPKHDALPLGTLEGRADGESPECLG